MILTEKKTLIESGQGEGRYKALQAANIVQKGTPRYSTSPL
jgi:hypothetical protein